MKKLKYLAPIFFGFIFFCLIDEIAAQKNLVKNGDFENQDTINWYYTSSLNANLNVDKIVLVLKNKDWLWISKGIGCIDCSEKNLIRNFECESLFKQLFDTSRNGKSFTLLNKLTLVNHPLFWKFSLFSVYNCIESQLSEPLKEGKLYQVSVDFLIVDFLSTYLPTGGIGILLTPTTTENIFKKYPPDIPILPIKFDVGITFRKISDLNEIPGYGKWYRLQGLYKAMGGEKFISISFFSDSCLLDEIYSLFNKYRKGDEMWKIWGYLIRNHYFVKNPKHEGIKCKYLRSIAIAIDNVSVVEINNKGQAD